MDLANALGVLSDEDAQRVQRVAFRLRGVLRALLRVRNTRVDEAPPKSGGPP